MSTVLVGSGGTDSETVVADYVIPRIEDIATIPELAAGFHAH